MTFSVNRTDNVDVFVTFSLLFLHLPQLQGVVEAEFQEKFQRLPGEIRDFLQDRKTEVRGQSKSRSSTPHDTLSEED